MSDTDTTHPVAHQDDLATATLSAHAAAIHDLGKRTIEHVIEIGQRLTECKKLVGHGGWLPWLDREFGWTDDTARNFTRVFELSKSRNFRNLNLPLSALYRLTAPSTPEGVRNEVIARAEAGEPLSVANVKAAVVGSRTTAANTATDNGEMADIIAARAPYTIVNGETAPPSQPNRSATGQTKIRTKAASKPPALSPAAFLDASPADQARFLDAIGPKPLFHALPSGWRITEPAHRDGIRGSDLEVTLTKLMRQALISLETARQDKEAAIAALKKISDRLKAGGHSICDFQVTIKGARATKHAA